MELARARAIVDFVVAEAPGPVSVFVADAHGEIVAAATMDGAAHDTRLNAQRKAYTAARSDARTTRELAEKVAGGELPQSFDPFFTFFLGGGPEPVQRVRRDRELAARAELQLPVPVDEERHVAAPNPERLLLAGVVA